MLTAVLYSPRGAHRVRIRDRSEKGAQLICESEVSAECDAILKRGSLFSAARIAWSNGPEAGLEFYRPLTPADVQMHFTLRSAGDRPPAHVSYTLTYTQAFNRTRVPWDGSLGEAQAEALSHVTSGAAEYVEIHDGAGKLVDTYPVTAHRRRPTEWRL